MNHPHHQNKNNNTESPLAKFFPTAFVQSSQPHPFPPVPTSSNQDLNNLIQGLLPGVKTPSSSSRSVATSSTAAQNDLLKSLMKKKETTSPTLTPSKANSILLSALKLPTKTYPEEVEVKDSVKSESTTTATTKKGFRVQGEKVLDISKSGDVVVVPSVSNITFYKSTKGSVVGRGVAVSSKLICYALKKGKIRVISQVCATFRGLLSGHDKVKDMVFSPNSPTLLASLGTEGKLCVWRIGGATPEAIKAFQRGVHHDSDTASSKKKESLTHELVFELSGLSDINVNRVDFFESSPFVLLLHSRNQTIVLDLTKYGVGDMSVSKGDTIRVSKHEFARGIQWCVTSKEDETTSACTLPDGRVVRSTKSGVMTIHAGRALPTSSMNDNVSKSSMISLRNGKILVCLSVTKTSYTLHLVQSKTLRVLSTFQVDGVDENGEYILVKAGSSRVIVSDVKGQSSKPLDMFKISGKGNVIWCTRFETTQPVLSLCVPQEKDGDISTYGVFTQSIQQLHISAQDCGGDEDEDEEETDIVVEEDTKSTTNNSTIPQTPGSPLRLAAARASLSRKKSKSKKEEKKKPTTTTKSSSPTPAAGADLLAKLLGKKNNNNDEEEDVEVENVINNDDDVEEEDDDVVKGEDEEEEEEEENMSSVVLGRIEKMESTLMRMMKEMEKREAQRQKSMLTILNKTLMSKIPKFVRDAVEDAIEDRVIPALNDALAETVPDLKPAFKEQFEKTLLPGFENAVGEMTNQIRNHFTTETRSLCDKVSKNATSTFEELSNVIAEKTAAAAAASSPVKEQQQQAPPPPVKDLKTELRELVAKGEFQDALWKALSEQQLELVLYVCELISASGQVPRDLSQPVLLCLGQQVARGLKLESKLSRITLRLMWIEYVAMLLDPQDKDVAPHIAPVLVEISRSLKAYSSIAVNDETKRKSELLNMAVNSLFGRCDR